MSTNIRRMPLVALLATTVACGGDMKQPNTAAPLPSLDQVTAAQWQRLGQRRFFFGHQSVGANVLEGVAELAKARPDLPIRVVETSDPAQMAAPGIYHAAVGRNGEPDTKIADFTRLAGAVGDSGAAMMKFCYIDITAETDPAALFRRYKAAVDSLRAAHPALTIVHTTLPLQIDPGTIFHYKTVIRGKQTPYRLLNAVRSRYNALLREAYAGKEPVFDLAHFQSILADGSVGRVSYKGDQVEYLGQEWSSDGGHLNAEGRKRMATAFLVTLAKL